MMERDVHATLSSLTLLVESTKGAEPLARRHSYAWRSAPIPTDWTDLTIANGIEEKALVQQEKTDDLMVGHRANVGLSGWDLLTSFETINRS